MSSKDSLTGKELLTDKDSMTTEDPRAKKNDHQAAAWGSRWLDLVEASPAFDEQALRRGADYASFDWQLDVEIEQGRASTTASSGKRMQYEAAVTVPTLNDQQIDDIVASIASETHRIAAVLDGELPPDLEVLLSLDPASIVPTCTCTSVDRPCKHAAAVAHLIADAIADEPFDLLHLRGVSRVNLIERLTASRRDAGFEPPDQAAPATDAANDEPEASEPTEPELAWSVGAGVLPPDLVPPASAGALPPFPTPPPPGASFDEAGLRMLANDGARRAHALLTGIEPDWVDLDTTTDLSRRAADVEGSDQWKPLVERAQVTSQELRARAQAWRVGGPAAVEAHVAPTETITEPDDRDRQRRRTHDGQWILFEKQKGRWLAVAFTTAPEPVEEPLEAPRAD